jgi:Fe-S oxidoreductase
LSKIQRGNFKAAYRLYRIAAVFPDIAWRLCDAPCKSACLRADIDTGVSLRLIEQACVEQAGTVQPDRYNLPTKKQSVAIVGADLVGLTCSLKLATARYQTDLYEQTDQVGGQLAQLLPPDVYLAEIERQFSKVDYNLHLKTRIKSLGELDQDAIYLSPSLATLFPQQQNTFTSALNLSPLEQIKAGVQVYQEIEYYLRSGQRSDSTERFRPIANKKIFSFLLSGLTAQSAIVPKKGASLSAVEAQAEAQRCALCDCSLCLEHCELLARYNTPPARLTEEVDITFNPNPLQYGRMSVREIGLCNLCGHCTRVCPVGADISDYMLKAKQDLFDAGGLPAVFNEYWLRDMDFANSTQAALVIAPQPDSNTVFFPGCQAGGSDPRYVTETFARLRELQSGVGLLLRCCGVPALWSGNRKLFKSNLMRLEESWRNLGQPLLLLLCPTCAKTLREYAPQIPCKMVYEILAQHLTENVSTEETTLAKAAVFDPCASAYDPETQQAVRTLAYACGCELQELPSHGEEARCCGWGGQPYAAGADFLSTIADNRADQSDLPYVTYCSNCRDILSAANKDCRHILDLLFNLTTDPRRQSPTITQRRASRAALKEVLAKQYALTPETNPNAPAQSAQSIIDEAPPAAMDLSLSAALAQRVSNDLILHEDIIATIIYCETSGNRLRKNSNNHFIGHLRRGYVTYWVEYEVTGNTYLVHNAYCHRMMLQE